MNWNISQIQIGLFATCGLLVVLVLFNAVLPVGTPDIPYVPARPVAPFRMATHTILIEPLKQFDAISARPLFDATRRPPPPPDLLAKDAPPPAPKIFLIGIIIDGQERLALAKSSTAPLEIPLKLGQSIGGWTVAEIGMDRIVVRQGIYSTEVKLSDNKSAPSPSSPQPEVAP